MRSATFHDFVCQRTNLLVCKGDPGDHLVLIARQISPRFGESDVLASLGIMTHDCADFLLRLSRLDLRDDRCIEECIPTSLGISAIRGTWGDDAREVHLSGRKRGND